MIQYLQGRGDERASGLSHLLCGLSHLLCQVTILEMKGSIAFYNPRTSQTYKMMEKSDYKED